MTAVNHNFYRFECQVVNPLTRDGQPVMRMPQAYTVCQQRIRSVLSDEAMRIRMMPEDCVKAISRGTCPALRMISEEMSGTASYYHDRDDVGPGVVTRAELGIPPRSSDEVDRHHRIAHKLKLKVYLWDLGDKMRNVMAYRRWQAASQGTPLYQAKAQSNVASFKRQVTPALDGQREAGNPSTGMPVSRTPAAAAPTVDVGAMITQAVAELAS